MVVLYIMKPTSLFQVIFIGIGLGLITLGFEYYWYKWRPAAKANKTLDEKGIVKDDYKPPVGYEEKGEKPPEGHENSAYD